MVGDNRVRRVVLTVVPSYAMLFAYAAPMACVMSIQISSTMTSPPCAVTELVVNSVYIACMDPAARGSAPPQLVPVKSRRVATLAPVLGRQM